MYYLHRKAQKFFLEYIKNNSKDITYEILESNIENNKATITVAVTYVNVEKFFLAIITETSLIIKKYSEDILEYKTYIKNNCGISLSKRKKDLKIAITARYRKAFSLSIDADVLI